MDKLIYRRYTSYRRKDRKWTYDELNPDDNLKRERFNRPRSFKSKYFSRGMEWSVINKYLHSRVGLPWNDTFSEFKKVFNKTRRPQFDIRRIVDFSAYRKADGKLYSTNTLKWSSSIYYGFYVQDGILEYEPKPKRKPFNPDRAFSIKILRYKKHFKWGTEPFYDFFKLEEDIWYKAILFDKYEYPKNPICTLGFNTGTDGDGPSYHYEDKDGTLPVKYWKEITKHNEVQSLNELLLKKLSKSNLSIYQRWRANKKKKQTSKHELKARQLRILKERKLEAKQAIRDATKETYEF